MTSFVIFPTSIRKSDGSGNRRPALRSALGSLNLLKSAPGSAFFLHTSFFVPKHDHKAAEKVGFRLCDTVCAPRLTAEVGVRLTAAELRQKLSYWRFFSVANKTV